jgi:hypothetical protein
VLRELRGEASSAELLDIIEKRNGAGTVARER